MFYSNNSILNSYSTGDKKRHTSSFAGKSSDFWLQVASLWSKFEVFAKNDRSYLKKNVFFSNIFINIQYLYYYKISKYNSVDLYLPPSVEVT